MGTGRRNWGNWQLGRRGRGIYRRQVGRWEEEFTTWHGTSKAGMGLPRPELAGREETCTTAGGNWQVGRWEKNLPQEMWHPRPEPPGREMGHPRWELADREMGRGIYRRRWDIQGRRIYHMTWDFQDRNWQVGRREEDLPREVGHPRWEVAGREMGRGIYHSRWELAGRETGRGIYRRRWDTQGGNWQVGRREEEFTAGDGTSKGDEFTTWHGTSKAGTGR